MVGMPFPGEDSPFTDLEASQQTYQMLNQTEVWVSAWGQVHLIDDMSVRYKANVVAFLQRRARNLASMYFAGAQLALASEPHNPAAVVPITDADVANPHAWLSRTPLMMRLLVDVAQGVGGGTD